MDNFVKTLIEEVKSQGVFDEFRFNCCLADVDTKPAYQNVRNRVETAVNDFLAKQHWTPDTNKVQLRERLRKHLLDSDVLDKGVDHIVDQVVNPKVATIFEPKIESIAYKFLGVTPPPPPAHPPPRPPLLPAPPLPPYTGHALGHMNGENLLKVETTASLLPTDLEQISPDSDRATVKSDVKEDSKDDELPPGVDGDDIVDDDDEDAISPAFEPATSIREDTNNASLTSESVKDTKELANDSRDAGASQSSQLSQVSSDSRLTVTSTDAPQPTSANNSSELTSNMAANMSEEAQMPKFSENSSDENDSSGRQLHFDIKQDAITFEGTERRTSMSESNNDPTQALSIENTIIPVMKVNKNSVCHAPSELAPLPPLPEIKSDRSPKSSFTLFTDSTSNSQQPKDCYTIVPKLTSQSPMLPLPTLAPLSELPPLLEIKPDLTQTGEEKAQRANSDEINVDEIQETNGKPDEVKPDDQLAQVKSDKMKLDEVMPEVVEAKPATLPIVPDELKDEVNKSIEFTASPASASSSSQTKKHSNSHSRDRRQQSQSHSDDKPRQKSRERERDKARSKTSSSSRHSSSHTSSHSSSSKHRSSSSKYEKSSTSTSSSRSNQESSSSKRSSSRHDSSSSSNKKHKSSSSASRSDRDRARSRESHSHHSRSHNGSGSSSSNSKRTDRDRERDRNKSSSSSVSNSASNSLTPVVQDDHNEVKVKLQKRHSNDSNDEGKPPGSESKSPTETVDSQTKENATEPATENGSAAPETNGSNGTNCTNGTSDNETNAEFLSASNVVIISDMLQQSTVSYIELSSAGPAPKPTEDLRKSEEKETNYTSEEMSIECNEAVSVSKSPEPVGAKEITKEPEHPSPKYDYPNEPIVEASVENESVWEVPAELNSVEDYVEPAKSEIKEEALTTATSSESLEESMMCKTTLIQPDDTVQKEEASETITHFEQDADEFKERLLLIEQHIKDRRQLLNVLSASDETNCSLRSLAKRRLSSEASSSKHHSSSSACSSSSSSSSSGSGSISGSPDAKAKRTRRDEAKTSPTPSDASVNSKENEELEKQEKGDLSSRQLSQKLCQQQRYTNEDLYKPRPLLSQRSRRRGLDSIL